MTKTGVPPYPGLGWMQDQLVYSKTSWYRGSGGSSHLRKFKIAILKKVISCKILNLTVSFPSFASQKPVEIPIFGTFWGKVQFDLFYWKSAILRFGHVYDVIMTSYIGYLYLFWYLSKFLRVKKSNPLFESIEKIDISIYQEWKPLIFLHTSEISNCKEWIFTLHESEISILLEWNSQSFHTVFPQYNLSRLKCV